MSQPFEMPKNNVDLIKKLEDMHQGLNWSQYSAAMKTDGPVMVIAGAGAGKTKTLIHRVATLLMKGVPPTSIMIVTFTNKAAGEIKDRLQGMVGENAQYINAGTFHSIVFQKMLQVFPDSPYLQSQDIDMTTCSIMDEDDAKGNLKAAIQELDQDEREWLEENEYGDKDIAYEMSMARSMGVTVDEFARGIERGTTKERLQQITTNVWIKYNALCRQAGGIDFDDILVFADKMLKRDPWIAEQLGRDYRYLMLDEYQDTNPVQMSIMDQIAQHHKNIFVVGDEKQSIYKFRGADINVILSFKKRYPDAKQIDMKDNYRSYPSIIMTANACAEAMGQKLSDGQLKSNKKPEESDQDRKRRKLDTTRFVEFSTSEDEARVVVDAIERDIREGTMPNSVAVLYRNKALKKSIEKEMVRRDIDYYVVNDRSFYDRAEVKDAIALLKFIYNPWYTFAGIRLLKSITLGLSEKMAQDMMKDSGATLMEVLGKVSEQRLKAKKAGEDEPPLTSKAKKVKPFYMLAKMLRESYEYGDDTEYVMTCLRKVWDIYLKSRYEARMNRSKKAATSDEMEEKIENAAFVFDRVEECLRDGTPMQEIIDDLSMRAEYRADMDKKQFSKVQLMTIHGSKGLEFDSVYMVGCNNAIMPGEVDDPEIIEEERRLFYVGTTRAAKKMAVTYSRFLRQYGEWKPVTSSPFIDEVISRVGAKIVTMPETDLERQISLQLSQSQESDKKKSKSSFEERLAATLDA